MQINLGHYSKAVTAVIGQVLTYASLYYGGSKWVAAAVAIAAALGVYAVPNSPKPPPPPTGM
jgi:hypothetical protein